MALHEAGEPLLITRTKLRTATIGELLASDDFKWSASQRLWRPAGEPWLRKELLVLWTFIIVLCVLIYVIIRVLLQMQTNVNTQTKSTLRLTEQVASVAARQDDQRATIASMQDTYQQVAGRVDAFGQKASELDSANKSIAADLQAMRARLRQLEHQQGAHTAPAVSPAKAPSAVSVQTVQAAPVAAETSVPANSTAAPWSTTPPAHAHQFLSDMTPPKTMDVKQIGEDGGVWILNRNGTPVVVRPFGTSSLGIWVHCSTDNRDYILTPSGGWMAGSPR